MAVSGGRQRLLCKSCWWEIARGGIAAGTVPRRRPHRATVTPEVECAYATRHREHHHPHPVTGRLVCHVCHPPTGAA
jgi:hypothetical protein